MNFILERYDPRSNSVVLLSNRTTAIEVLSFFCGSIINAVKEIRLVNTSRPMTFVKNEPLEQNNGDSLCINIIELNKESTAEYEVLTREYGYEGPLLDNVYLMSIYDRNNRTVDLFECWKNRIKANILTNIPQNE